MDFNASREKLITEITNLSSIDFEFVALKVFQFQAKYNPVYAKFISLLSIDLETVDSISKIPFLPISLFKEYKIKTGEWKEEAIFESSGTTGQIRSKHFVRSLDWYNKISQICFEKRYGNIENYCVLALLPSYLERKNSSLVHMAQNFINKSKFNESGFFLDDFEKLRSVLQKCVNQNIPTLLIGVSFGLLDFAEQFPTDLQNVIVMETGGMKGRRKELTRTELHERLMKAFQTKSIHSEYGMTELLSQAYSKGKGIFQCNETMQVMTREITDPLSLENLNRPGVINVIDLANIDSCSFIGTDDLGRVFDDGNFEVLGRLDSSDIRGCNLMVGNE